MFERFVELTSTSVRIRNLVPNDHGTNLVVPIGNDKTYRLYTMEITEVKDTVRIYASNDSPIFESMNDLLREDRKGRIILSVFRSIIEVSTKILSEIFADLNRAHIHLGRVDGRKNIGHIADRVIFHSVKITIVENDVQRLNTIIASHFQELIPEMKNLSSTLAAVINTNNSLKSAITIFMDKSRTQLALFSEKLNVFAIALGFGSFVGGIFGMNMNNGLENRTGAFVVAAGITMLMTGLIAMTGLRYLSNRYHK
uniref:CorA-like Mg2+ transporter protein n=1 Tax=Pithovirus LCDPAC01 TaxID=2506600 RepID=A0A481YMR3_9VIRU|nr:MAG: CorA-like Mg2+ transporter protein [Pithovirus LCDPAC01]